MSEAIDYKKLLAEMDGADESSILSYGQLLEDMTFRDVHELGIYSPKARERAEKAKAAGKDAYGDVAYKGGMGNFIEERYFGYDANPDDRPDFPEAGVEVKTTCYDVKRDGEISAGERVSVTMVPLDKPIDIEFDSSHCWEKSRRILLIYYHRDKTINRYDQQVKYVMLFTPPEEDLQIIREDYDTIVRYVREGRADELSEGLTTYLGAATKGATAEKSMVVQYYPFVHEDGTSEYRMAKKRGFSLKRGYMDYVLHNYVIPERAKRLRRAEFVASGRGATAELDSEENSRILLAPLKEGETFASRIQGIFERYFGMTEEELCGAFGVAFDSKNKSLRTTLARRILGITSARIEEFEKANIRMRSIRVEPSGRIKESFPLVNIDFEGLAEEDDWYESELFDHLDTTKFFFVVFRRREQDDRLVLSAAKLWSMPGADIERYAHACWENARAVLREGVRIVPVQTKKGIECANNLPGQSFNGVVHVRPRSRLAAYKLDDGTEIGDIKANAKRLPDGRYMTKQAFWLDSRYIARQVLGE